MVKQIIISIFISAVSILCYHMYLEHTGRFSCVKGIYSVNLVKTIDTLKKKAIKNAVSGKEIDPEAVVKDIQNAIDTLAKNLPEGYLLVPDSCVLAGKRKKIDLLKGTVHETCAAEHIAGN